MNHHPQSNDVIVSGIHLELTPSLKTYVREKMERLYRHHGHIVRIRVELECDRKHNKEHKFLAKAHVELRGPDINATVDSDEMHKSIDMLIDKLDAAIRRRHGQHKDKRNHPRAVEWGDVEFPKAV